MLLFFSSESMALESSSKKFVKNFSDKKSSSKWKEDTKMVYKRCHKPVY